MPLQFPTEEMLQSAKAVIADSMIVGGIKSWILGMSGPTYDIYKCLICNYSCLDEKNCVNHVTEEHDDVLEAELRMKN